MLTCWNRLTAVFTAFSLFFAFSAPAYAASAKPAPDARGALAEQLVTWHNQIVQVRQERGESAARELIESTTARSLEKLSVEPAKKDAAIEALSGISVDSYLAKIEAQLESLSTNECKVVSLTAGYLDQVYYINSDGLIAVHWGMEGFSLLSIFVVPFLLAMDVINVPGSLILSCLNSLGE